MHTADEDDDGDEKVHFEKKAINSLIYVFKMIYNRYVMS